MSDCQKFMVIASIKLDSGSSIAYSTEVEAKDKSYAIEFTLYRMAYELNMSTGFITKRWTADAIDLGHLNTLIGEGIAVESEG